jgi:hypothetical protein
METKQGRGDSAINQVLASQVQKPKPGSLGRKWQSSAGVCNSVAREIDHEVHWSANLDKHVSPGFSQKIIHKKICKAIKSYTWCWPLATMHIHIKSQAPVPCFNMCTQCTYIT